jgi:hypothetical protein
MCAVPNMAVFCSSLISWIPGTLLRYFYDSEMVPVAPIITGITFVFTFLIIVIIIIIIILLDLQPTVGFSLPLLSGGFLDHTQ